MTEKATKFSALGAISISISLLACVFPYLFPSVFPEGTLPYFTITIPLGIVAAVLAIRIRSFGLTVLAAASGLSPLLLIWLIMAALKLVFIVSGGYFPNESWI